MRKFMQYYRDRYIRAMRMYNRTSKLRAGKDFDKLVELFDHNESRMIAYILFEIDNAREQYEWRKHHVIRTIE